MQGVHGAATIVSEGVLLDVYRAKELDVTHACRSDEDTFGLTILAREDGEH
jgi:hypothetical protein